MRIRVQESNTVDTHLMQPSGSFSPPCSINVVRLFCLNKTVKQRVRDNRTLIYVERKAFLNQSHSV